MISNFQQLKAAVADWLKRDDLAANIPTFVALAESNIRRDVRVRDMEAELSGDLTQTTLSLPARFLEARRVILGTSVQEYLTPNEWHLYRNARTNQYTIFGEQFRFQRLETYKINYFRSFPALSFDGDSNWLLLNGSQVYLWASLEQAAIYLKDDGMAATARRQYQTAIHRLNTAEQKFKFGGPLAVRVNRVRRETNEPSVWDLVVRSSAGVSYSTGNVVLSNSSYSIVQQVLASNGAAYNVS